MARPPLGVGLVMAMALLTALVTSAVGCASSGDSSSSGPFERLQQLAPIDEGTPVLLFVYTDG